MSNQHPHLGIDIGSITVKVVVYDPASQALLWSSYMRHHARQQKTALDLIAKAREECGLSSDIPVAVTGSGAQEASEKSDIPFVQEVNALIRAVQTLYPDTKSVIELGGEDAKMVIIDEVGNGEFNVLPVMNEKCAAGTGSMIERMIGRMDLSPQEARDIEYYPGMRHPIAAKCGVFAETDIVGLVKNGVAREELLRALYDAIVQQNLSTLAKGRTPNPKVLLLGGPHLYFPGLVQCWRHRLKEIWRARGVDTSADPENDVVVPELALFLPAIGAVLEQAHCQQDGLRINTIEDRLRQATTQKTQKLSSRIAFSSDEERRAFTKNYTPTEFTPPNLSNYRVVRAHLGIDCGSTSIKAALLDDNYNLLRKEFAFATHDPIADTRNMIKRLRASVESQGPTLIIESVGVTGYAKDILESVLQSDIAVVETIAHKESALLYYPHADVICDVGGQDIKVMLLEHGGVTDFRLNTQCSAGTGYFLQTVASRFDISIYDFAKEALRAEHAPEFSAGCTIFLQSDIVNFMRAGYSPAEIMAGVVQVLPQNIWVYAARLYNLPAAGDVFVLQGGTQRNLAAVRAQVQYIRDAFADCGKEPAIFMHPHPAEAGAIGCALLAAYNRKRSGESGWIGFEMLDKLQYESEQSENTRCTGCVNRCARTIIRTTSSSPEAQHETDNSFANAIIIAPCDRGRTESNDVRREIAACRQQRETDNPNFARVLEAAAFSPARIMDDMKQMLACDDIIVPGAPTGNNYRILVPRVLNFHIYAPLMIAWFLALGFKKDHIIVSPRTTRTMSSNGTARATIDPCFPAKICFAHVEALLQAASIAKAPSFLFFPAIHRLPCAISDKVDSMACTVAAVMPEVVNAAYTLETNEFHHHGVRYLHPLLSLESVDSFCSMMGECFAPYLEISRKTFRMAAQIAWKYQERFTRTIQIQAKNALNNLAADNRLGIVLLGRPYHADRGLNHGIFNALQEMGFPLFTADTLPQDHESLAQVFSPEELRTVRDVWSNPFSENSSRKMWAAKYAARHPNLLAVELSNFKCGHDAPTYSVVREIFHAIGKPFFSFLDLDENTPQGTLNIRLQTIRHFLEAWSTEHGFTSPQPTKELKACVQMTE